MSTWYLDTSACLKLLVEEPESEPLAAALDAEAPGAVACWLLETELRRAAHRLEIDQVLITDLLAGVDLYEVPGSLFREAGHLLPGTALRSLDSLHLAAAVRIGVDAVATYDLRMAEGAHALGLDVRAPA